MPKLNITEIYHTVFWYRGSLTNAIFDRIPSLLRFMAKSRQKIAVVGISQILQNPNTLIVLKDCSCSMGDKN